MYQTDETRRTPNASHWICTAIIGRLVGNRFTAHRRVKVSAG